MPDISPDDNAALLFPLMVGAKCRHDLRNRQGEIDSDLSPCLASGIDSDLSSCLASGIDSDLSPCLPEVVEVTCLIISDPLTAAAR